MVTTMSRGQRRSAARQVAEIPMARRSRQLVGDRDAVAELAVPFQFRCPISLDLMRDPVTAPTGITYDRDSVEGWLERGHGTCPVTGRPVLLEELVPNHATRRMIQEWCVANRGFGVERVPTPRAPATAADVSDLLAAVSAAAGRGDASACRKMVAKARALAKESDRNHRCFVAGGAGRMLSSAFCHLAGEPVEKATDAPGVLEAILMALVTFFPLDEESRRSIASQASLKSVVSILSHGELASRISAAVVLREIASSAKQECLEAVSKVSGICETLVKLVEKPISPQATKAALVTAYYLVTATDRAAEHFVDLGMVSLLVELLVDSDKGMSEKALAVLDGVLNTDKGREVAYVHALAVPVLVKKLLHVSEMATEFAVSALWRLCKNFAGHGGCKAAALQEGAFQKLLLLLQVGCGGVTKERATELLKLLKGEGGVECIETVDFKELKRPF